MFPPTELEKLAADGKVIDEIVRLTDELVYCSLIKKIEPECVEQEKKHVFDLNEQIEECYNKLQLFYKI